MHLCHMPAKAHGGATTRRVYLSGRSGQHERAGLSAPTGQHRCLRLSATQYVGKHNRGGEAAIQALLDVYTYSKQACFNVGVSMGFFPIGGVLSRHPCRSRPRSFQFSILRISKVVSRKQVRRVAVSTDHISIININSIGQLVWAVCRLHVPPQYGIAYPSVRKCKKLVGCQCECTNGSYISGHSCVSSIYLYTRYQVNRAYIQQ